jgi:hypothetical protein
MKTTIELCKAACFPLMSFEGVTYVSPELERLVVLVRADERAALDLQAELDATNRQVEILSDALAESRRQRQWVGLTDEEIQAEWLLTPQHDKAEGVWFGRRLEAKLKEKNT